MSSYWQNVAGTSKFPEHQNVYTQTTQLSFSNFHGTYFRYNWKRRCFYQADNTCFKPLTDESYEIMDDKSRHFLQTYFTDHNSNLEIILKDIHQQQLPHWLSSTSVNWDTSQFNIYGLQPQHFLSGSLPVHHRHQD